MGKEDRFIVKREVFCLNNKQFVFTFIENFVLFTFISNDFIIQNIGIQWMPMFFSELFWFEAVMFEKDKKHTYYYGYVIAASCFGIQAIGIGT